MNTHKMHILRTPYARKVFVLARDRILDYNDLTESKHFTCNAIGKFDHALEWHWMQFLLKTTQSNGYSAVPFADADRMRRPNIFAMNKFRIELLTLMAQGHIRKAEALIKDYVSGTWQHQPSTEIN